MQILSPYIQGAWASVYVSTWRVKSQNQYPRDKKGQLYLTPGDTILFQALFPQERVQRLLGSSVTRRLQDQEWVAAAPLATSPPDSS